MNKPTFLAVAIVTATLASPNDAAERDFWFTLRGVDQDRMESWVRRGATIEDVLSVMTRIANSTPPYRYEGMVDTQIAYGPGHWVFEWSTRANLVLAQAEELLSAGEIDEARASYLRAAELFSLAKAIYIRNDDWPHYEAAYQNAMAAYETFGALLEEPLEIVEVPYGPGVIRAYVHLPPQVRDRAIPVVIGAGGIDVFKTETWPVAWRMMEAGMAYVSFDMPGMGETNYLANAPNHETAFLAVRDAILQDDRFDANRIAAYGTSWTGNAILRLAVLYGERFDALVSACGPVHAAFDLPVAAIRENPVLLNNVATSHRLDVLADRLGIGVPRGPAENVALAEALPGFSLVLQGILPEDAIAQAPPLLVINSRNDPVLPVADMSRVAALVRHGTVVFTGDGGHCGDLAGIHDSAVAFFRQHLNPPGR